MNRLNKEALQGLARFLIAMALMLFLPAWTLDYWQAWVFLVVFSTSVLAITVYLMKRDPKLLERRMNAGAAAEKEKGQKIIMLLASAAFVAVFIVSALDHRHRWSSVPAYLSLAGDVLVAVGLLVVFFVFKENTFSSAVIEVDAEQRVITTGPYAVVRHPMYIGALIMLLGIPPALGSWRGLAAVIPLAFAIVWRLIEEERFLAARLAGYAEYQRKVRYRLVPFVW